jgi:23S rRNA (cytosine1962-C5)-methyltransferase
VTEGRRVAVRATPDAVRQLRAGSPWLYDRSIVSVSHEGSAGDLAVVFDARRRFVAIGLYDPASPVRVRVVQAGAPAVVDESFWRSRFDAAVARRAPLVRSGTTTAYRVLNGENDGFPALVLDRYDRTLVLKLYSAVWFPHLPMLVRIIGDVLRPDAVVLRLSRRLAPSAPNGLGEATALLGALPPRPVPFLEEGLAFEADVVRGPKTGHFLDQRDNRVLAGRLADGARVLDVFSSTGGFTVHAAAGRAASVHAVDISAPAVGVLRRNVMLNEGREAVRRCGVHATVGDAFEVMDGLVRQDERYDLVVIDPPSFAPNASSVPAALRAYARLTRLGVALIAPGGTLLQASCSSRVPAEVFYDTVVRSAEATGAVLHEIARTGHPLDHPVTFPEGAYLKALVARVERR